MLSRYKGKLGDLAGTRQRVTHKRRASSRIVRKHLGDGATPPQAPRRKPFIEFTWFEISLSEFFVGLLIIAAFAAFLVAVFCPSLLIDYL